MFDVVIIGAGPAGASAALFAAKAGKKTLLLDNDQSIIKKAWLENYYGLDEIAGPELFLYGKEQAKKFGAELIENKVINISKKENSGFIVETENGNYEGKHVILATGMISDLAKEVGIKTKPGREPRMNTIIDVDANGKTNIDGIWAAGTIAGLSLHTIITAGDGARVAINVISELNGDRYVDHDILKV